MTLAEIEDALIELVNANLPYLHTCETGSSQTIDEQGNVLARTPAVLFVLGESEITPRSVRALANSYHPRWALLAGASNLRGVAEEKKGDPATSEPGVYQILDGLRALAGTILTFDSGGKGMIVIRSERLAALTREGTWYEVVLEVQTDFQNEAAAWPR